ncbi:MULTISPECIES: hypothetical protein [unclassified Mameliella]|uniref:hypothetical protein n=1 Tax=unclassified Mameliella TaxID=2630630 RepID=UPI0027401A25|nr:MULTISPECIES: hypothetical protein [unclassified Mameliella]
MTDHPEDRLQIALRIGGGEVFAIVIESQSRRKGWIVIGLIVLVVIVQLAAAVGPELAELAGPS